MGDEPDGMFINSARYAPEGEIFLLMNCISRVSCRLAGKEEEAPI